jgi:hypothetical protein
VSKQSKNISCLAMYSLSVSIGFARLAESSIRKMKGKAENESLGAVDKILSSSIGMPAPRPLENY